MKMSMVIYFCTQESWKGVCDGNTTWNCHCLLATEPIGANETARESKSEAAKEKSMRMMRF